MYKNKFKITSPTCIQFSAGRSSAYMLWRILEANNGLPNEAIVCFDNTGKEDEASLSFVHRIETEWNIPIVWLEYCFSDKAPAQEILNVFAASIDPIFTDAVKIEPQFKIVSYETASRKGEPFDAVIRQRGGILPNPRSRYCSSELKTRTTHRYLRSLGWTEWDTMIGIRADEPLRVARFRANPHPETKSETVCIPLADAGISANMVGEFWRDHPFDLGLPNIRGKTMHGNCDLCYLKPAHQIFSLIAEKPSRAIWWAEKELSAEMITHGNGNRFRIDRPSYVQTAKYANDQTDMFDAEEEGISCLCGD